MTLDFNQLFALRGAVASVALSHDQGCVCDVCRAAAGDTDAFQRVALAAARGDGQ